MDAGSTIVMTVAKSESGITVNAVGPTPIDTDLIKNVPEDTLQDLLSHQCIKRFGKFDDVKNVASSLISEDRLTVCKILPKNE